MFVDCCPKTKCICPAKIEAAITPKTKAIIPVHLYGQCADMVAIKKIADKHKLKVIEDNAQAIGAAGPNFKIGELSDAATTSFIIQKNLGTFGDSGALVTNNADIDATVRKLRNHGSNARNVHSYGFNSRLDDLHAGVLSAKLKHIDAWNDLRRKWAARYTAGLKDCKTFDLPVELPGYRHVFHLYVIETKKPEWRDQLVDFLVKEGVDAKTHYSIAIHKQAGYPWGKGARIVGSVAERRGQRRLLRQPPDVPRTARGRSRLRHRQGEGMGCQVCLPGPGRQRSRPERQNLPLLRVNEIRREFHSGVVEIGSPLRFAFRQRKNPGEVRSSGSRNKIKVSAGRWCVPQSIANRRWADSAQWRGGSDFRDARCCYLAICESPNGRPGKPVRRHCHDTFPANRSTLAGPFPPRNLRR